jgi:DNA-binding CsgD family transcriptional regulator
VENIFSLIELISAAASTPDTWDLVLGALVELLNGDHAVMFGNETGLMAGAIAARFGVDEHGLRHWSTPEGAQIAAPMNEKVPIGRAVCWPEFTPDRDWERTAYYNELVRPMSGFYGIAIRQAQPGCSFLVVVCRGRNRKPFADAEVAAMHRLLPHVTTAVELGCRLRAAEAQSAGLARALDRLKGGVILTDAAGLPCFVNEHAAHILDEEDGLLLNVTGLAALTPRMTDQLRRIVVKLATNPDAARSDLRIERPSGRRPLILSLQPVWHMDLPMTGFAAPRVAIFIKDTAAADTVDPLLLPATYDLTRRENEVATLLASGLALEEIADRLEISIETVRSHLKRIFDKTGTHNQAALVALVRGISTF